jgi:hypothetical protein
MRSALCFEGCSVIPPLDPIKSNRYPLQRDPSIPSSRQKTAGIQSIGMTECRVHKGGYYTSGWLSGLESPARTGSHMEINSAGISQPD